MRSIQEPRMRESGFRFFGWFLRAFSHPLFTPEADEKRFLAGLPIAMIVTVVLWKRVWFLSLIPNPVMVLFALWCTAYLVTFRKRLKHRSELTRAILAPAIFVALLLAVSWY